jgi:hypothetical protein
MVAETLARATTCALTSYSQRIALRERSKRETTPVCELTRVQGVIPLRPCSSVGCSDIFVFVAKNLADLLGL